jgi:hypothetical protein
MINSVACSYLENKKGFSYDCPASCCVLPSTQHFYVLFSLEDACLCFCSVMNHLQAIYMWPLWKLLYLQRIHCFRFNIFFCFFSLSRCRYNNFRNDHMCNTWRSNWSNLTNAKIFPKEYKLQAYLLTCSDSMVLGCNPTPDMDVCVCVCVRVFPVST